MNDCIKYEKFDEATTKRSDNCLYLFTVCDGKKERVIT